MNYFKLGVQGEGFSLFFPDSYSKDKKIIGSGIRRTISGKGKRDIVTTKSTINLGFEAASELETASLFAQFEKQVEQGKELTFIDDEENSFIVLWSDNFGLSERIKGSEVHWSGNIVLEEV
jgi:hypothetical protein